MNANFVWVRNKIEHNGGYANIRKATRKMVIAKDGVTIELDGDDVARFYNMVRPPNAPAIEVDTVVLPVGYPDIPRKFGT